MQIPEKILLLIQKYQEGDITEAEKAMLDEWYHSFDADQQEILVSSNETEKELEERLKLKLLNTIRNNNSDTKVRPLYKWRIPAAAAALFIIFTAIYFIAANKTSKKIVPQEFAEKQLPKNDIVPGGNKAILTLADGSTIVLDSASNGTLGKQGNIKIQKLSNGLLAYTINGKQITQNDEQFYNTITTPRGGKYQMILADGSKVWLNAASSIRFPVIFTGTDRKVEITGEAYFEVAKNKAMPFRVNAVGTQVEVLGTHFNVNAYDDEAAIKTTLLEGAVKVTSASVAMPEFLKPGQQSVINKEGKIAIVNNADTSEAVAWKNGRFQFASADIKTILRQISRWYNVDVIYNGISNIHFSGQLSRSENVSKIFEQLAMTGEVHFKIEGKNIIVSP